MKLLVYFAVRFLSTLAAPFAAAFFVWREQKKGVPVPSFWDTPDDSVSPRGLYEPTMKKINDKFGTGISDWVWLGWRNTAYGHAYAAKPQVFKELTNNREVEATLTYEGSTRVVKVLGYTEKVYKLGPIGLIYGYRLGPMYGYKKQVPDGEIKHPNMAGRPICSFRKYENCVNDV